ncbi:calcium-binding and coiled-coil domain-containing protein 2 isoform X1 [Centropristis striata]|uniref:calcium-binding and coiled-coil domain-containing protein 2 isoform X1 n=1 Tax=Centropristis striata TaxID=184440 RepID=UPI0027E03D64|nr:calcium-binding and coiled-coil domain-containing protein 2 isoform X1 [Centropristis striata]
MEGPSEAAADPKARTFSQVVFTDTPHSYPPATPVTCCYTRTAAFQPNPRDWVGIFKVGWSTTKDYHTFVWVDLDEAEESASRNAVFKEYYLPKDEIDFYQFCYVDNTGQVRGASTPFCFKNPVEQSIESSPEDDLLVITTQEQVEQSVREKAELQKELDQIRQEKETIQNDLQKKQQEAAGLKGQNEQKDKEISQLVKEMDQIKEQNENLKSSLQKQIKETDGLKEEVLIQMTKQMEMEQHDAAEQQTRCRSLNSDGDSRENERLAQEKYDRAVVKINQMKEEREQLRGKLDAQSVEVATLNSKLREQERELLKLRDSTQLLQVDLQSSEKEKGRLSKELQTQQSLTHDVDNVRRENQELSRRLSQQESLQNCPDDDLRVRCQTLTSQLQDAQAKLSAEREENRNTRRQAEALDRELQQAHEQLHKVVSMCEEADRMKGKLELLLNEAHAVIAEKVGIIEEKEKMIVLKEREQEELTRDNQTLQSDIEGLRSVYADLHAAPPADSSHLQPEPSSPAAAAPSSQETPEQAENIYENIGDADQEEEQELVCRHCQERFPGITQHELETHEQSHRVCPFCTMICDTMEQAVFEDHVYSHEM